MGDTTITVIAIFLAAILMFVFPLVAITQTGDNTAQLAVQTATSNFVNSVAQKGYISQADYDAYCATIGATGNTYDIKIEVQKLDENLGKKASTTSANLIGENVSYSIFTDTILSSMSTDTNGKFTLNQGDNLIVTVNNTNMTLAQLMRNFMYKVTGNNEYAVGASASSMVI